MWPVLMYHTGLILFLHCHVNVLVSSRVDADSSMKPNISSSKDGNYLKDRTLIEKD